MSLRLGCIMAVLSIAVQICVAQVPEQAPAITAAQVLDNNIKALGGTAAAQQINRVISHAVIEVSPQHLTGTMETYQKRPNKLLVITRFYGLGTAEAGFDGSVAWSRDPGAPLRILNGVERANYAVDAVIDKELRTRELFQKVTLVGRTNINGHNVYVIKAESPGLSSRTMYFDSKSWLEIEEDFINITPRGNEAVRTFFADYRKAGGSGIKVPFAIRIEQSDFVCVWRITDIRINAPIEDSIFQYSNHSQR